MTYDTIIIGSGYASFGYALTHKNTLVIDEAELCDKFFGGCGNMGNGWDRTPISPLGKTFYDCLEKYEVIHKDKADIAALESVFCRFLSDYPTECLFLTQVESVKKCGDVYTVTIYGNEGYSRLEAKRIIVNKPGGKKRYTAVRFRGADSDGIKKVFPDADCFDYIYDGESIAHIPSVYASLAEERKRIVDVWWEKSEAGLLLYFFPCFGFYGEEPSENDGILHIDESRFDTGLDAFEFGGGLE